MAKFVKKTLLYFALILAVFLAVRAYTIQYRAKNYFSAFVDKLQLLSKNKKNRKIILLGGSNVGFSVSAQLIEQQTGIKTINLGHNANFGLVDFQEFVVNNLNKNDIIIFSPEWEFYENPGYVDPGELDNLIVNNLNYGLTIGKPFYVLKSIFSSFSSYEFSRKSMEKKVNSYIPPYIYNSTNANGDIVAQCKLKPQGPKIYKLYSHQFDVKKFISAFPFIRKYKTVILFPPSSTRFYDMNEEYLNTIQSTLNNAKLMQLDAISNNVYSDDCFFDEAYHLTCECRAIRTNKIIAYLKNSRLIY